MSIQRSADRMCSRKMLEDDDDDADDEMQAGGLQRGDR